MRQDQEAKDEEYAVRMAHYVDLVLPYLEDEGVTEIYTDPSTCRVSTVTRKGRVDTGKVLTETAIRAFLNVAAERQRETLDRHNEHIQAQLPTAIFGGARLQGVTPRIVKKPCFNIRKRASAVFPLQSYVDGGAMAAAHLGAIREAARAHKNILVFGGTGSGKTTLVNAILGDMARACPGEDFLILEDTPELQGPPGRTRYLAQTLQTSLRDLVKIALRMLPDRIIVGEVRDEAALELMEAWLTGHPGGAGTVHASSPAGALRRMERLARRASDTDHSEMVAEAIDLVVGIERAGAGRRVRHVCSVADVLDERGGFVVEEVPGAAWAASDGSAAWPAPEREPSPPPAPGKTSSASEAIDGSANEIP